MIYRTERGIMIPVPCERSNTPTITSARKQTMLLPHMWGQRAQSEEDETLLRQDGILRG